jgi:hypothetical protein
MKFSISFISRIAFICNICFAAAFVIRRMHAMQDPVISTILIAGLVISIPANIMANFLYAVVLLQKQPIRKFIPVWVAIWNFLSFICQIYMFVR